MQSRRRSLWSRKKEDCVAGTWTEGLCSVAEITEKDKCQGTPTYSSGSTDTQEDSKEEEEEDKAEEGSKEGEQTGRLRAVADTTATCTVNNYSIKDPARLASRAACEVELAWVANSGRCSTSTEIKSESDCKKTPEYTAATEATCVDGSNSLSFKIALAFVICLLF